MVSFGIFFTTIEFEDTIELFPISTPFLIEELCPIHTLSFIETGLELILSTMGRWQSLNSSNSKILCA